MNTIVAIPFDSELASFIGKRGSENSITFYNRKFNEHVVVGIMPSSIEEKFYALPQCMLVADQILVSTKSVDRSFGEVLIACSLLGKRTIFTKDSDITGILSGMTGDKFSFSTEEELLDAVVSYKSTILPSGDKRIDIDKSFNVKGIGTVVLGVVTKGTVKVHDNLFHNSGKTVGIRSIQSQDADIKEASVGTRVGLALKGMDEGEIQKGDILASTQARSGKRIGLELKKSAFVKEDIEVGKSYSFAAGFSYSSAAIENIEGSRVTFRLEKSIAAEINDQVLLVRTMAPRMFASGRVLEIS